MVIENNDLASDLRLVTNEKYSQVRRLKGMNMGVSVEGQLILQKLMSSRLPIENMDEASRILSSNIYEN